MSDPLFDYGDDPDDPVANWQRIGRENKWEMPRAPHRFLRFPVVRHLWVLRQAWLVDRHYSHGLGSIGVRTGYDEWVLWGMWRGMWPQEPRDE